MSVYVSWSDEISVNNGKGEFIIAGVVAPDDYWPSFSKKWAAEILESEPRIPYLHMIEIRRKTWFEEHKLTWEDGIKKVDRAIEVICEESPLQIFMSSLPEAEYTAAKERFIAAGGKISKNGGHVDYPCSTAYATSVMWQNVLNSPIPSKFNFYVSNKKYVSHHLQKSTREGLIRYWNLHGQPWIASLVGEIAPLTMELHTPLQAADVVCWHLNRAYAGNEQEIRHNQEKLNAKGIVGLRYDNDMVRALGDALLAQMNEDDEA